MSGVIITSEYTTGDRVLYINTNLTFYTFIQNKTKTQLLTLQEHMSLLLVLARYLLFCLVFYRSLFVLFLLAIVLSVLQFTDSDYPFGIIKLFL